MDIIPYDDMDTPYWNDDQDEIDRINGKLVPSDFYFHINDDNDNSLLYGGTWFATIIPKKYFDETGYFYDQCLSVNLLLLGNLPFDMGCDEEVTYSPFDASITAAQGKAELEKLGFIYNSTIWEKFS